MKKLPIYEMLIDENVDSDMEVDFIALVDKPAIKKDFVRFSEEFVEGMPHYTKEGVLYTGPTHKDASGRLMTGETHNEESVYLYHEHELADIIGNKENSDFGGEGSGCSGDNCGRPAGSENVVDSQSSSIVSNLESGNPPSMGDLIKLSKENPKAADLIGDLSYSLQTSYQNLDGEQKEIFDKLSTSKDYELYRTDTRYDINNTKPNDVLDFDRSPTFVSSDVNYVKDYVKTQGNNNSIIVFPKGTKSIRHKGERNHEVINGKYEVDKIVDNQIILKNKKVKSSFSKKFAIQDEEKRIISGPLMIANQKIYRNDPELGEYEVYFSPETIKKIAIKLAKKGFHNNVNLMHSAELKVPGVTLFEIFQSDKSRGIMPMKGFEDLSDGSLFGSMYVENDVAWQYVKDGLIKGFSVEGNFGMKKKDKYDETFEKIVDILNETKD
jgi:hypothetical protein